MRMFVLPIGFPILSSMAICQIPQNGADLKSLSALKWGMTMQEVQDHAKQTFKMVSDSVLSTEDSLVGSKATVLLTFSYGENVRGLSFVEVQIADNGVADTLLSYLKSRYGTDYKKQHQEKTKLFFFTLKADSYAWTLEKEGIALMRFARGDDVIEVRLLYSPKYKKKS
jgi:hypothetical protein